MWIYRELQKHLPELAAHHPVLVLTGSRQVGKTSLLETQFAEASFVSLDLPRNAAEAEDSGESFLERLPPPLIIDEVQYAPGLFRFLKHAVDRGKMRKAHYFLTGSERFALMAEVSESLAGRAAVVELGTLSHLEMETAFGQTSEGETLLKRIWMGGYPALHADPQSTERFYSNLIATYIDRDVRKLINVSSTRDFDRFLRLCALRTGQLWSSNNVASDLGVSQSTITKWLHILEASQIITLVPPWFTSASRRLVKTPKIFFMDTGLACALAGFSSPESLSQSPLLGSFFETHVFGQLWRSFAHRGMRTPITFFRSHDGAEIDFVVPKGQGWELMECKWSENPRPVSKSIDVFRQASGCEDLTVHFVTPVRGVRKTSAPNTWIRDSVDFGFLHNRDKHEKNSSS